MSIIDSSPKPKTVTLNNGALVSTLKSRFGGASLLLNGLNQYASIPEHTDFGFGTGDFTIEMWVYPVDNNNYRTLISMGTHTDGLLWRMCTEGNQLWFNGTPWNWGSASVPLHTWSHLALVRNSGTIKVYINGTESLSVSGGAAAGNLGSSRAVNIGAYNPGSETFNGYLDEVRITKGIGSAKYNSNFDVKTLYAPFPSSGTPVTPPNAPTDLITGPLGQKINMIWTAPAEDNGGIITDYSIQFKADGETNWSDFAHTPSLVPAISVTGLIDGTTYSVRVGAINYIGVDAYVSENNLIPTEPAVDTNPDPYFYSTSLLLHFDGAHNSTSIVDSSYLTKTSAAQGAKISIAKNRFGGSSMYFNGSGDYVTVPDHPGFDFGAEDFTIEYWEYRLGSGTGSVMCRVRTGQGVNPWLLGHNESGTLKFYMSVDYANWAFGSLSMGSMIQNAWTHYAVVRQGNTVRTYQNGSQVSTASFTGTLPIGGGSLSIGRYADNSDNYFHGYLDDIRITRGVCRYPDGTTFSVPVLPYSNVAPTISAPEAPASITAYGGDASAEVVFAAPPSDKAVLVSYDLEYSEDLAAPSWTSVTSSPTRLLLHFNKGDIRGNAKLKDYSLYNRNILWNTNNNPAFIGGDSSSNYQKFGDGCLDIQYNRTSYASPYIVKVDESSDLNPGTGDYTLEMFLMLDYPYTSTTIGRLFGSYNASSGSYFGIQNISWDTVRLHKYVNGSAVYYVDIGSSILRGNTDYYGPGYYNKKPIHLAFCRQSGTIRIYVNGNKVVDRADTNNDNFSAGGLVVMGGDSGSHYANNYVLGRMDELRYTVGEALYVGDGVASLPSSEFKNAKIINIPNDKNYIFRLRGQNSGGYGNYVTSSSVSVATPPVLTIVSEPENNRVLTYNESATFSVSATISDSSALSYQWQKYDTEANDYYGDYGRTWQNISGATGSTLTINTQGFNVGNNPSYSSPPGKDPVRCIITSSYSTVATKSVRLVNMSYIYYNSYDFNMDGSRSTGSNVNIDGNYYNGYYTNSNERFSLYIYYNGFSSPPDDSWYSGNDSRIKFQYSLDPSGGVWTDANSLSDIDFRYKTSYILNNNTYLTPTVDLSGRVYFRTLVKDLWPYNTNNGSSSSTESSYSVVQNGYQNYFYIDFSPSVPGAPSNVVADPGDGLAIVSWNAPTITGGATTTSYAVQYALNGGSWTTFGTSTSTSLMVTGLNNGSGNNYTFRAAATNSAGTGSYSAASSSINTDASYASTPGVPTNITGIAGNTKVLLNWVAPSDIGKSALTDYVVQLSTDDGVTWENYPVFSTQSVILSSDSSYTVPNGAKVIKIWSIGAGGSTRAPCDGGGATLGNPGVVSYRHGLISDTNVAVSGSIGQPVAYVCDLSVAGGSTTLSNLSTVITPSISSLVGGGGGNSGGPPDRPSSGGFNTYTLWSNNTTRRDYFGVNSVINAAGENASTHTSGRGSTNTVATGSAGAIVMQFLPATDLVIPFTGSGSLTIPAGYSSVKIWAVGGGGAGNIYCDGGPTTVGGVGGISYKTWSVSSGQTITYNAGASLVGTFCQNPTNGNSSTASLNGTTITATGGLGNGSNGSGSGGDGGGIYGSDVGEIYGAYLSYSLSVLEYGSRVDSQGSQFGGIVLVKFIV